MSDVKKMILKDNRKHEYDPIPMVMKDTNCPRQLTLEEVLEVNWNEYSLEEIDQLISAGSITETQMIYYYNNIYWRETP